MLEIKHNGFFFFLHSRQVISCSPGPSVFISAAGEIDMFFSGNRVSTKKYFVLPCLNLWENVWKLGRRKLVGINNWHTIFLFIMMLWRYYEVKHKCNTLESLPGIQEVHKISVLMIFFLWIHTASKPIMLLPEKVITASMTILYDRKKKDSRWRVNRFPSVVLLENPYQCCCKHPNPTWPLQSQPYSPSDIWGLSWARCSRW